MVRFKVGITALNTNNMSVSWPNNPWQGLIKNNLTASKTATLNADILDAGGCGQLIEPVNGVLPANANVILVTSFNLDTSMNTFGALTNDTYIIYQNNPSTASGHFANSGSGLRTMTISFPTCSDTVTYNRALLVNPNGETVAADGAIVLFSASGTPTYINNGCSAPVPPFTVDAGANVNACSGTTITLNGAAQGQSSVRWTAASGSFSASGNLSTNYTISPTATGILVLTLTAVNSCGAEVSDTITINLSTGTVPNFATPITICTGAVAPILNTTSPNGISGTWTPSVVNNTISGNYRFVPNAGQCASEFNLRVEVGNSIVPNFTTPIALCTGAVASILNTISPNGISGTWTPSVVNNTISGNYRFVPNAGQCALEFNLRVEVGNSIVPDFPSTLSLCSESNLPVLNLISPNGITGTWTPSVISKDVTSYVFLPNSGQCAQDHTLNVIWENPIAIVKQGCVGQNYLLEATGESSNNYIWKDDKNRMVATTAILNVTELLSASSQTIFPIAYELSITNNGCTVSQTVTVDGVFCSIPKGISPNNDHKNDTFDLTGLDVKTLSIFNRYGTEVYHAINYTNQWNGATNKGDLLPDGVYYYVITTATAKPLTGWVYINR